MTTDITTLPPADRALIVLNSTKTEADLRELAQEAATVTEVKDSAGREQAHRLGMRLKTARTTIEKAGKAAREDAQAFSKAVIAEEKRLIGITEAEEKRVLGLRDGFDAQVAAEKAAKEAAERARMDEIRGKIDAIRRLPLELTHEGADAIRIELDALATFKPTPEVFGEFVAEAAEVTTATVEALATLLVQIRAREEATATLKAEQERLVAERAALEAERYALAQERAALAAAKGEVTAPAVEEAASAAPEFIAPEDLPDAGEPVEPEPVAASDWTVRRLALATAMQFAALSVKVEACGVPAFANELRAVAYGLREGDHDARIAAADWELLLAADRDLIDATVNGIEAMEDRIPIAAE